MVAGIGVGYALMIASLYTAELSPAMTRGFLTSLPEVFITLGILLGYIINYALTSLPLNLGWRLMLAPLCPTRNWHRFRRHSHTRVTSLARHQGKTLRCETRSARHLSKSPRGRIKASRNNNEIQKPNIGP